VLGAEGDVVPDLAARAFGRGAWLHPSPDCIVRAVPRGLAKSFRAPVRTQAAEFCESLRVAADRRAEALVASARRAGKLVAGGSAVEQALEKGRVFRVIVAKDARASGEAACVVRAAAEGRASAWGDKALLGRLAQRPDTALIGVLDAGLAHALERAVAIVNLPAPRAARGRQGEVFTEEG
jgi:predicted RNA-binding protein YlxR (DUF448 family)